MIAKVVEEWCPVSRRASHDDVHRLNPLGASSLASSAEIRSILRTSILTYLMLIDLDLECLCEVHSTHPWV